MDNRRDFLKKAALLSGMAGISNLLPDSIQRALAIEPAAGSTFMDAEHVVLLMQENRSFDHAFGNLMGVRGYNDPRAIDLPNKNKVWAQTNDKGETYSPFHLDIKNTKSTWLHSLPHSWKNQVNARHEGKFDQWLNAKRSDYHQYSEMPLTMGYHTREDIPFYYALADAFTICDQNFCSALTGTNPNRLYFWTGTVREEQNENARAHVWNDDMDYGTLKWATFPERLEENGISWKCYQNEMSIDVGFQGEEDPWLSNFQDNPLEFFAQYNIQLHEKHVEQLKKQFQSLPDEITALKAKIAALPKGDAQIDHLQKQLNQKQSDLDKIKKDEHLLEPGQFEKLSQRDQSLHLKAFDTNKNDPHYHELSDLSYDDEGLTRTMKVPKGDVLHQFREDVKSGNLPTVSWLSAPESFSDHPSAPWYGAWYVSEVMDILTQNPEVWKKTIFILAYDENDGYFDHIPPFTAPHSHKPGTGKVSAGIDTRVEYVTVDQERERNGFPEKFDKECSIGLGFRVPLIVASPWSKGGFVNSEVFDHTSTLQFLETLLSKKTGKTIRENNISDWRRMVCGDLTSVFRPYHNDEIKEPEFVVKDAFLESIHKAQFRKLPSDYKLLTQKDVDLINQDVSQSPYMPSQEKGIRPACSIPYQIYADGVLNKEKKSFEIHFVSKTEVFGKNSVGAPFNVYAPGRYMSKEGNAAFENLRTWSYGVKAGDELTDEWPLHEFDKEQYHLRVYGPNGFFREYKGDISDPELGVTVAYQTNSAADKLSGNIELHIQNLNKDHSCQIEIVDNSYGTPARQKNLSSGGSKGGESGFLIDSAKNYGWYDFSIRVKDNTSFEKRFAGRVETGKDSFSDPLMGKTLS